jgi:hypothetical protein
LSIGRRWGNEGYQDASFYDSNSAFLSVQKIFNNKHSLNLAMIYAPNRRGKVSPNTQEVYDLKAQSIMNIGDGKMVKKEIQE